MKIDHQGYLSGKPERYYKLKIDDLEKACGRLEKKLKTGVRLDSLPLLIDATRQIHMARHDLALIGKTQDRSVYRQREREFLELYRDLEKAYKKIKNLAA